MMPRAVGLQRGPKSATPPHALRSRRTRVRACVMSVVVAIAIACGESIPVSPGTDEPEAPVRPNGLLPSIFDGTTPPEASEFHERWEARDPRECVNGLFLHPDSISAEGEQVACAATMAVVAPDSLQGLEHAPAVGFTGPITVTFSAPVSDVVIIRYGPTPCAVTNFTGATAFAADSTIAGRDFTIMQPCEQWIPVVRATDAGLSSRRGSNGGPVRSGVATKLTQGAPTTAGSAYEDFPFITQWAEASFGSTQGITRLRIDPSLPWEFFNGLDTTLRNARYTVMYRTIAPGAAGLSVTCAPSPVVRADTVSCLARRSDNAPLAAVHWIFRSTDSLLLGYEQTEDGDSTWSGPLLVSGWVIASAASSSGPLVDSTPVRVTPRN